MIEEQGSSSERAREEWCYECQCFHENPRSRKCREAAKKQPGYPHVIGDMLDYN